jgi:hypothetical protein
MSVTAPVRQLTAILSDMHYAVQRMTERRLTRPLGISDEVPGNYAEFLLRTSVSTVHEPSARRRAAGKPVRLPDSAAGFSSRAS